MMYCPACGHQMHESALACPSCGKRNAPAVAAPPIERSSWFGFQGRIPRKEYWLHYVLPIAVIGLFAGIIDGAAGANGVLSGLVSLVLLVPSLAGMVKRLHDRDHTGWLTLVAFIPIIGNIWFFVEGGCMRGTPGPNRFGPDPLAGQQLAMSGSSYPPLPS